MEDSKIVEDKIDEINKNFDFIDNKLVILNDINTFDVADIFLYRYYKTYVYKYNFISILANEILSTIHDNSNIENINIEFQNKIILNDFHLYE